MPQLDSVSQNPKQPQRSSRPNRVGVPPLPAVLQERRRKLMWVLVAGIFVLILGIWVLTFPSRIASNTTNQSAWATLKSKISNAFSFGKKGDEKIQAIDVNAPTAEDLQHLREQVFPATPTDTGNTENSSTETSTNAR